MKTSTTLGAIVHTNSSPWCALKVLLIQGLALKSIIAENTNPITSAITNTEKS
jgi:hypothetical protein